MQVIILLVVRARGVALTATLSGVLYAISVGACISIYSSFLFITFAKVDAAKATPIIYMGAISVVVLFGVLYLKESLSWTNVIGLLLGVTGIFLFFR